MFWAMASRSTTERAANSANEELKQTVVACVRVDQFGRDTSLLVDGFGLLRLHSPAPAGYGTSVTDRVRRDLRAVGTALG